MARIRDLMSSPVETLNPSDSLGTALDKMSALAIRHLPVVDRKGRLRGLITQRDLLRQALAETSLDNQRGYLDQMKVEDVMTVVPYTVDPDLDLSYAARTMLSLKYGCLPVIENERLVGILTEADFLRLAL